MRRKEKMVRTARSSKVMAGHQECVCILLWQLAETADRGTMDSVKELGRRAGLDITFCAFSLFCCFCRLERRNECRMGSKKDEGMEQRLQWINVLQMWLGQRGGGKTGKLRNEA